MQTSLPFKDRKRNLWLIGMSVMGILGTATVAYLSLSPQSTQNLNLTETVLVQTKDLQIKIKANGVVQPVRKINLGPKEAGRVAELFVREGDTVQQGQLIARMDSEQIQAQVRQFQAALERAESELAQKLAGNRQEDIAKAEADVEKFRSQLAEGRSRLQLATQQVERKRIPVEQGAISRDSLDQSLTEERNAKDNLNQLQSSLTSAQQELIKQRNGFRVEEISQAKASVAVAKAQLQDYKIQLINRQVLAPFAGIITRRFADVGDFITPTTSVSTSDSANSASIAELSSGLEVEAKVLEASIALIQIGQPVEVRSDSYPDRIFRGQVQLIAPRAIQENNVTSFRVKVKLDSGLDKLKAGMNVKLSFVGKPIRNALSVPLAAIVTQKNGQQGLWVVEANDRAKFRVVRVGAESEDRAQILEGVKPNDRVFLSPPANQNIPGVDNTEGI
jgi:HlyD family secretion protein